MPDSQRSARPSKAQLERQTLAQSTPLHLDFSDGVDRKVLRQVRDRFLFVNQQRLDKTNAALSVRQADMLRVLPLLYQVNHPLLPGFVDRQVPAGVANFEPDKTDLAIARSFSQTFRYRKDKRRKISIHSLFMMGSSGTLAHSDSSDVDLWLCHDSELSPKARELLARKAQAIDLWANSHGLELHTFLMDAEAFRTQQTESSVDAESSGSTQHFLLLDEFYRTAILLAGRYPLWWLIPANLESEYERHSQWLLSKRFIKETDVIDFGCVAEIPKSELLGAGLWQLYKSLDAPYKSVLKLMLAEVYAQQLPAQPCLSLSFKQAVYDAKLQTEKLDPYYLIYQRLDAYLKGKNEVHRLDLVRKSFYLKVDKALSRPPGRHGASWQRQFLEHLVRDWAWPESRFAELDSRRRWQVEQVLRERQQLLAELTHSYKFLSSYARANNIASSITALDLTLLGRKLYATFQRKAGKVDRVNPGITADIWEENLAIHHASAYRVPEPRSVSGKQGLLEHDKRSEDLGAWLLYRDLNTNDVPADQSALRKSSSLLELLCWLYFNGILTAQTRLSLNPGEQGVSMFELKSLVQALSRTMPMPLPKVHQEAFMQPAYVKHLALFINLGVDPMRQITEQGLLRLSDRSDSLGYSSQRYNLVKTIDQLALNSWNELSVRRYELGETLMQNLQAFMLMSASQRQHAPCQLHIFCFASVRAEAIAERVKHLFDDVKQCFIQQDSIFPARYVLEIEERFYVMQWIEQQFRYQAYLNQNDLFKALAKPAFEYSPVVFDRYALPDEHLVRVALRRSQAGMIQLFYRLSELDVQLCVLDEFGSLQRLALPLLQEEYLLSGLNNFIRTILERQQLDQNLLGRDQLSDVEFFCVKADARVVEGFSVKARKQIRELAHYAVQATVFYQGLEMHYDLQVLGRDFSYVDYGENQFSALTRFVQSIDDYDERLPLVLSDLSFPSDPMLMRSHQGGPTSLLAYLELYAEISTALFEASV